LPTREIEFEGSLFQRSHTISEWRKPFKAAGFDETNISICKNPRYKYLSRAHQLYYLIIERMPNFIISKLLGSEIHIIARKGETASL
jgi:hypothetical protein